MKALGYIAAFVGGLVAWYFLSAMGFFYSGDLPTPVFPADNSVATYLSFLSVMMTAVTVVLAVLGIGIGIVAVFTFAGIREEIQKVATKITSDADERLEEALTAVEKKVDGLLSEEVIQARVDQVAMSLRQTPSVAELEEDFDKEDDGNR
ncbi:hypothetical protein [Tabrizicola sp.]|uniref:hypothetical protein n=1 Tax=Tabrizicola sp. TaxID=2005166 RepID=UPI0025D8AF81|nr:hypothetical protein [Tabrizicola sp.]